MIRRRRRPLRTCEERTVQKQRTAAEASLSLSLWARDRDEAPSRAGYEKSGGMKYSGGSSFPPPPWSKEANERKGCLLAVQVQVLI